MKIYFAGSIRGGDQDLALYQELIEHLKSKGEVLTEHLWDKPSELKDSEIFERDLKWIKQANVFVCEVSTPSLGVGYELAVAEKLGKKVLCLYNSNSSKKLSAMITGNEYFNVKDYADLKEALFFIDTFFEE